MSTSERRCRVEGVLRELSIFTVEGTGPGPTLALMGGVHGDEMEGPVALARLLAGIDREPLAGRLIVVPVANPDAVAAGMRCSPVDGCNLARCFPGKPDGRPTERLAALLASAVIARADALLDLHSGGAALAAAFFSGYGDTGPMAARARQMAEAFGAPAVWRHGAPAGGRTLSEAHARGIPSIYVETTGGIFPDETVIEAYRAGTLRVMQQLGMIPHAPPAPTQPPLRLAGSGDIDKAIAAPKSGFLQTGVAPLDRLRKGQVVATVLGLDGRPLARIAAPTEGIAVFVRRARWVEDGDTVLVMAQQDHG